MKELAFRDALKQEIAGKCEARLASVKVDRLPDIVEKGREVYLRFSQQRLNGLLNGLPPDRNDRLAIDHALGVPVWLRKWPLESDERRIAVEAGKFTPVQDLAEGIADYAHKVSFRNQAGTAQELWGLFAEALYQRQIAEELQLFGLA